MYYGCMYIHTQPNHLCKYTTAASTILQNRGSDGSSKPVKQRAPGFHGAPKCNEENQGLAGLTTSRPFILLVVST